ncbi:multisubunit Na+/H+ antiporter MnhG subunit [Clostridium algifaecis]|uniref:Multisubunit Na+/H+ antiporter MnhG subunit n=1 Tax=Clostridium algifaecis TaxID=1472040 RepID=A0ABS4KSN5_9CLOT|nr:hypothetical protein [Clostridium algifaecis]MBP2032406.1 multisubunit Na+/H+ antiporter MnhG subunit [Clostridium algifaecis]
MKITGILFTLLGVLGVVCSGYMYGGIKLITMTGSLGSLLCGIGFILSYVNFIGLYNNMTTYKDSYINKDSISKAV